ncbi:MAG TPA: hypothetical protein VMT15_03045 [Bryobacteraceae bacterium]|nr:hypothetical protein [Bryobacteraceae bacterium]
MIPTLLFWALAADYPQATISNGVVTAKLMLPDAQQGSYQGTRFDWSGIIWSLTWNGHEFFGQWYPKHDPKIHDAITGPVEEFLSNDAGLGYDEVKPGETFLRIGVGSLRKPEEKAYRRFATYEIVDPGKRSVRSGKNWIEFGHQAAAAGYAYDYRKTIRLENDKPEFLIEHVLKNTGTKPIDTLVYNHNFFVIDNEVVGPDVVIRFPWAPKPDKPFANGGEVRGEEIRYQKELQTGETVAADLGGFGAYDVRIENQKAHAGVHITGDRPLAKLYFWSIRTVACPEPYIRIQVEPNHEAKWIIRYVLYTP